jgi:hypothetical protein
VDQVKIRRKSDSDYRLRGVAWSDIENQGLVFSRCALEVKGRAATNVIGLGDLFRGFVQSLCKMVRDITRSPKGLRSRGLAQSYHLIETYLGITESVSLLVADAIEASQELATILH